MTGKVLTSLNCIDRSIGERTHCAGYETDQHVLIRWKLFEVRLKLNCQLFELLICGEVDAYRSVSTRCSKVHLEPTPPWFVACLRAVRETPRYKALKPSSRTILYTACPAFRYWGISWGSARECICACNRIFTTSIGHTTATASVTPAPKPAVRPKVYQTSVKPHGCR